jgi:hypothetical protein
MLNRLFKLPALVEPAVMSATYQQLKCVIQEYEK